MLQSEDYRVFRSPFKQLDRKFNTWCIYTKRLDTYGRGCLHECKYCYSRALLDFRGNWLNVPAITDIEQIKNTIRNIKRGDIVRIGGMTDCFQQIEQTQNITYQTIKYLNKYRIQYLIVTKSDLVAESKYLDIYDPVLAHFQISISSTDNNRFEKAPDTTKRIKAIEILYNKGFDVSVRLSPFLFNHCDLNIINGIKCDKILIEFLKVNHWIKKHFDFDYTDYTVNYGGHLNLSLEDKIYWVNKIYDFDQISVGEYVPEHYEYFRDNVNYNKKDCCNLQIKPDFKELQLNLFSNEN